MIGDVAAGSFLHTCRDQISGFTCCRRAHVATGTGNGRTPLLGAGARIRCIPAHWLDVATGQPPRLGYDVPHITASSTTTPRHLHSLLFTPIYSNGTTLSKTWGGPLQSRYVSQYGISVCCASYPSPSHEAFRWQIKFLIRIYGFHLCP
jgi:hypothetical protein